MGRLAALLCLTLSVSAQLPPGTARVTYQDRMNDAAFFAATPDGTLWAASLLDDDLASVDLRGAARNLVLPQQWRGTRSMSAGPDGALWLGGVGWVVRIDPATTAVQRWPIGTNATASHLQSGPDGNVWFVQGRSVVRMRPAEGMVLSTYDAPQSTTDAAFGSDGALYLAATDRLVRIPVAGPRETFPARLRGSLYAGPGFFWSATPAAAEPQQILEIVKLSLRGETLATYRVPMTPLASDALGNLWLRASTADGDVVAQLSPFGVLTRFAPLPPLPSSQCHPRTYGGLAFLADGRVAISDFYLSPARALIDPCLRVARPAELRNTVTILDPGVAPVSSVQPLSPTRRRIARH